MLCKVFYFTLAIGRNGFYTVFTAVLADRRCSVCGVFGELREKKEMSG